MAETDDEEALLLRAKATSNADIIRASLKKSIITRATQNRTVSLDRLELSKAECRGIERALHEIELQKQEVENEGLSPFSFFVGGANVVLTAVIFCKWPEWLWLFYGLECAFFLPSYWYMNWSLQHHGYATMVEICWLSSHMFGIYMLAAFFGLVSASTHQLIIPVFYSCSMGFMSWFCAILGGTLIYHSLEKTASLFVHFTPCLVSFTLKFHLEEVAAVMPNLPLDVLEPDKFVTYQNGPFPNYFFCVDGIFLAGWYWLASWWVVYSVWLIWIGCNNPNSTFRNMHRNLKLGAVIESKLGLKSVRSHAVIYLLIIMPVYSFSQFWATAVFWGPETGYWAAGHGIIGGVIACGVGGGVNMGLHGLVFGMVVGPFVGLIMPLHIVWVIVIFLSALWKGAKEYDFIFAKKYTMVLHSMLEEGTVSGQTAP